MIWLPAVLAGSLTLPAKDRQATVKSYYAVDVCSKAKEVLVTVNIGSVSRSDSLFSYDLELQHDTTKIKFFSGIFTNTLTEFFEYKNASFYEGGKSVIQAGQVNPSLPPVSGNRELTAVLGNYLSNCPDTTEVTLNYIGFNEDFKDTVVSIIPAQVLGYVADKPERRLKAEIPGDTLIFEKDTISQEFKVNLNTFIESRLDYADVKISVSSAGYKIGSLAAESNEVELDNVAFSDDSTEASVRITFKEALSSYTGLKVSIIEIERDTNNVNTIDVSIIGKNRCACITRLEGDRIYIKGIAEEDTTVDAVDNIEEDFIRCYYDRKQEKIIIESKEAVVKALVYDYTGSLKICRINDSYESNFGIDASSFTQGVYFLVAEFQNKQKRRLLLLKD